MTSDRVEGFAFTFNAGACRECRGFCCRGESGNIWVDMDEIKTICAQMNVNVIDGLDRYFLKIRNRFTIRETDTGDEFCCAFLDASGQCSVYGARPAQCRTFPFWDAYRDDPGAAAAECPGVVLLSIDPDIL